MLPQHIASLIQVVDLPGFNCTPLLLLNMLNGPLQDLLKKRATVLLIERACMCLLQQFRITECKMLMTLQESFLPSRGGLEFRIMAIKLLIQSHHTQLNEVPIKAEPSLSTID